MYLPEEVCVLIAKACDAVSREQFAKAMKVSLGPFPLAPERLSLDLVFPNCKPPLPLDCQSWLTLQGQTSFRCIIASQASRLYYSLSSSERGLVTYAHNYFVDDQGVVKFIAFANWQPNSYFLNSYSTNLKQYTLVPSQDGSLTTIL